MKTVIKYISLALLFTLVFAISLLFVPPVTKSLVQNALHYFLEVDANVTTASLSLHGLEASGTLDQNDTFNLSAKPHALTKATITLHYDGNVHTFSNVATVELPYIAAVLDATFTTQDLRLDVNASALNGTIKGYLSLEEFNYGYLITDLNVSMYQQKQTHRWYTIPGYMTGLLSAEGGGIIKSPYTVGFNLKSRDLQFEKNATASISPELQSPLALYLESSGSVNTNAFIGDISLKSSLMDVNITNLYYDFNQSLFGAKLDLLNHKEQIAPLKHAALGVNGSVGEKDLNASCLLWVDDYQLQSNRVQYNFKTKEINLDYKVTSIKDKPLNLQGDRALFGDLAYSSDGLTVTMDSKELNSPVLLTLKADQLYLISNNMPLKALQETANREVVAEGDVSLEADANLSSKPILWQAKVTSKNLKLPWKYRKELGLKNDLALTISARNENNGDIVVQPALRSDIAVFNYSALRYKPALQLLFFNLNAKKIKSAYYQAPRLNIRGSLNIAKSRLNKTTMTTPYENVVIEGLYYSDKGVTGNIDFVLTRLDRFASLNRDYRLSGKTFLDYTPQKTEVEVNSKELGALSLEIRNSVIKLSGKKLPVEQIMRLTEQPLIMKGDLSYNIRYSSSSIKTEVTSDRLSGFGDFNRSIRPFTLEQSMSLKHKDDRYRGQAIIKTDNETFEVTNAVADLSKKQYKSRYKLDIKALERSTFILPKELKGALHVNGDFEQNGYQHLILNLLDFQLPRKWLEKVDGDAAPHLETNASIEVYSDKGLIRVGAGIENKRLQLKLHQSDYNLKTGDFHLKSDLKTDLWLKDTNVSAAGKYKNGYLYLSNADITTAHETLALNKLQYVLKDQNLSTEYQLHLKHYPDAPYHSEASIYGEVETKPELYATMTSDSLGGLFNAYLTDTDLNLRAKDVSLAKLIAFGGQVSPVTGGTLDSTIKLSFPSLLDGNLSTIKGRSDINITEMVLQGVALDDSLKTLRDSQDLNLFQGSFSELPIIRSLKNIPSSLMKEGADSTHFGEMRFLTDINDAMLHCTDCAIATDENLIAIKGDLNLRSRTFHEFYVGLLFPTNCAYFIQQVKGKLREPQVELAAAGFNVVGGTTKSLIGNIGSVLDIGADIVKGTGSTIGEAASYVPVVGETTDRLLTRVTDAPKDITAKATECTPFYKGTVKHPKQIQKSRFKKEIEKIEKRKEERR